MAFPSPEWRSLTASGKSFSRQTSLGLNPIRSRTAFTTAPEQRPSASSWWTTTASLGSMDLRRSRTWAVFSSSHSRANSGTG